LEAGLNSSKEENAPSSSHRGTLTLSWEADLWAKVADNHNAASQDVAQQQALFQSAQDRLAAEVMMGWLGLIAQQDAIQIQQRRLNTLSRNAQFIRQRYRHGIGNLEDLDSARTSLASARATLEEYRDTLAQQQRSLKTLLGRSVGPDIPIPTRYPSVVLPLAELPPQTLRRRPDLQAAYVAIKAAGLRTAVAYKEMLPSISLQAALEDMADSPGKALLDDPVWSLLSQLTAPLFKGGQLKAAADVAELQTAQAYQAYRKTLITAVHEVQQALDQEQSLAKRQAHIKTALNSARNNLKQYQRRYRTGLVSILDLLQVQRQTYDLEAQWDTLRYQRLANRINLGLALGLGARP
jgi:NodT family efflux transporter outer membrane factor (OMF) lipoprotein